MTGLFVVYRHRVVWIYSSYCVFVFCQSVSESTFGASYVEATAVTLKSVYNIGGVAVGKTPNLIGFLAEDVHKALGLGHVGTVVAVTAPEVSHRAL